MHLRKYAKNHHFPKKPTTSSRLNHCPRRNVEARALPIACKKQNPAPTDTDGAGHSLAEIHAASGGVQVGHRCNIKHVLPRSPICAGVRRLLPRQFPMQAASRRQVSQQWRQPAIPMTSRASFAKRQTHQAKGSIFRPQISTTRKRQICLAALDARIYSPLSAAEPLGAACNFLLARHTLGTRSRYHQSVCRTLYSTCTTTPFTNLRQLRRSNRAQIRTQL